MLRSFISVEFLDEVIDDDWANAENIKDFVDVLEPVTEVLENEVVKILEHLV